MAGFPVEGVKMLARELRLGDTVRLFSEPWGCAVVVKIEQGLVHFFRPYVQTSDYVHSGGVTPLIGAETFSVMRDSERGYVVISRKELE